MRSSRHVEETYRSLHIWRFLGRVWGGGGVSRHMPQHLIAWTCWRNNWPRDANVVYVFFSFGRGGGGGGGELPQTKNRYFAISYVKIIYKDGVRKETCIAPQIVSCPHCPHETEISLGLLSLRKGEDTKLWSLPDEWRVKERREEYTIWVYLTGVECQIGDGNTYPCISPCSRHVQGGGGEGY